MCSVLDRHLIFVLRVKFIISCLWQSDDSYSCDDNGNHHNDNDDNDDCTKTEAFLLPEGWQRHEGK